QPKTILHIGGQLVSKRLLNFLQKYTPEKYILINENPNRYDPEHLVTNRIEANIQKFCEQLFPHIQIKTNTQWLNKIIDANKDTSILIEKFKKSGNHISEIAIAQIISKNVPNASGLFLASSMPIRDMDMYAGKNINQVTVGSNRGASGIDGTIASAAGFARGLKSPVTLVIGDIAFIHDLNSLALLSTVNYPLIIILINNHGSGIFSFLPISKQKNVFEKYFATPHSINFRHAAKLFEIRYHSPKSTKEFLEIYNSSLKNQKSTIIEIETNREENYKIHKQLESRIVKVLEN
ncbi:thiamine pyrophosphate-dependent enzyme, partial [Calditrichota bacterium]